MYNRAGSDENHFEIVLIILILRSLNLFFCRIFCSIRVSVLARGVVTCFWRVSSLCSSTPNCQVTPTTTSCNDVAELAAHPGTNGRHRPQLKGTDLTESTTILIVGLQHRPRLEGRNDAHHVSTKPYSTNKNVLSVGPTPGVLWFLLHNKDTLCSQNYVCMLTLNFINTHKTFADSLTVIS